MTQENFDAVIEFAIEREKEAVAFYQELQGKTKFHAQTEMLKELENMERGHITILQNIHKRGFEGITQKQVTDLHISDYIVPSEPDGVLTYQDIVIIAMKREEASRNLYADLAERFAGSDTGALFSRLSAEEAEHKLRFEKIYDDEILKDN